MNEADLLFTQALNCNRLSLYLNKDLKLSRDKSYLISSVLKRRIRGEPLEYILGKAEFMGFEFKVTRDVFIPRPETEILVEKAISQLSAVSCQLSDINILDLSTGSGCIAISLAKYLPHIKLTATDISHKVIEIAQYNARLNNVINQIKFIRGDLFDTYDLRLNTYDLIVSNPPYIPNLEINNLQSEIKYEPRIAIDGGVDGLDFYRRIIRDCQDYLKEGGFLIMEMGFGQSMRIKEIFSASEKFKIVEIVKDYNNIERVIVAKNLI